MSTILTCSNAGMCIADWLFLLFFIAMLGVTLWQLYRIMIAFYSKEYADDRAKSFVAFIASLFLWVVMFVITMLNTSSIFYSTIFNIGNFLLGLNVMFFIINIFIFYSHLRGGEKREREVYYSRGDRFLRRF